MQVKSMNAKDAKDAKELRTRSGQADHHAFVSSFIFPPSSFSIIHVAA